MDEDSSTERKTWQVYSFGQRTAHWLFCTWTSRLAGIVPLTVRVAGHACSVVVIRTTFVQHLDIVFTHRSGVKYCPTQTLLLFCSLSDYFPILVFQTPSTAAAIKSVIPIITRFSLGAHHETHCWKQPVLRAAQKRFDDFTEIRPWAFRMWRIWGWISRVVLSFGRADCLHGQSVLTHGDCAAPSPHTCANSDVREGVLHCDTGSQLSPGVLTVL